MNEERDLAKDKESPVWDTIEGTHASYNNCLKTIITNL